MTLYDLSSLPTSPSTPQLPFYYLVSREQVFLKDPLSGCFYPLPLVFFFHSLNYLQHTNESLDIGSSRSQKFIIYLLTEKSKHMPFLFS